MSRRSPRKMNPNQRLYRNLSLVHRNAGDFFHELGIAASLAMGLRALHAPAKPCSPRERRQREQGARGEAFGGRQRLRPR